MPGAPAAAVERELRQAELRPGVALDVGQGRQVRLLDGRHAALARVQRSVLVQLRDAGRAQKWWVVDPVKKTKTPLFDNAKMAAQLTRILRTPYDAQHLPITHDQVHRERHRRSASASRCRATPRSRTPPARRSPADADAGHRARRRRPAAGAAAAGAAAAAGQQGGRAGAPGAAAARPSTLVARVRHRHRHRRAERQVHARERAARWATVSPDKQTVVFARDHNLFMMDAANFEMAKKNADDPAIDETQLTTDGEKYYSYAPAARAAGDQQQDQQQDDADAAGPGRRAGGAGASRASRQEVRRPRVAPAASRGRRTTRGSRLTRSDERKVEDLWVINALANPRPTLETYKYGMPGEENQPQAETARLRPRHEEGRRRSRPTRSRTSRSALDHGAGRPTSQRREAGRPAARLGVRRAGPSRQDLLQPHAAAT